MGTLIDGARLMEFLKAQGCDEKDGGFCVDGNIVSFMGAGGEYCIGDSAVYYVDGEPRRLAHDLNEKGRGMAVKVI